MQLYKRLRREYEHGLGTISGVANKYKVHRRTVRAALKNAEPPKRKVTPRGLPKMALAIPFIDAILENDLKATPAATPGINPGSGCKSGYRHAISGNRPSGRTCGSERLSWI
jgi:hypothetical protein